VLGGGLTRALRRTFLTTGWQQLIEELDSWRRAGATATFWWRDDDAIQPSVQLDFLLACAGSIPLAMAVIPALATKRLGERLRQHASVTVLQHGWRHDSHLQGGKNEYPPSRAEEDVSRELSEGRGLLGALFGEQAIPVFVPPFHGFDDCFLPLLRRNGLIAISRKGPRSSAFAADGLLQTNAHVAPIRWSIPPSFEDDDVYLETAIDHLRGRRLGFHDPLEPTGLLTHHRDQNARSCDFIAQFVEIVSTHPAATWLSAREIFGPTLNN
jgi:hypothetical protein